MTKDDASAVDVVQAGLAEAQPARCPCPVCGAESKAHEVPNPGKPGEVLQRRICINRRCTDEGRTVFDPAAVFRTSTLQ